MRRDRLLLAALLLAVTLATLPILTYPLGRDQGEFATIGRGILDGRVPYIDLWNPKPPAVFYVYALAMAAFGRTTAALRAIDLLIVPIISLSLYWIGKRIADHRVGLWAALLFAVFYFSETFWTLTQNDGIALLPMTLAMVCAFKAADTAWTSRRDSMLWAFAAGALAGYTVWFKYPFALFSGVFLVGYLFGGMSIVSYGGRDATGRDFFTPKRYRFPFRIVLGFLLGALLVGVGGVVVMAATGALPALIESAQVTSQYTALTFNAQDFGPLLQTALGFRWQQWGLLWVLAGLWFVLGRTGTRRKSAWGIVLAWLIVGLLIMVIQAKAYDYHWLPMLPPLALMAADSVDRLIRLLTPAARRGLRIAISSVAALAFLCIMLINIWPRAWPYLTGQESQVAYYAKFQAGEFVADASLQAANYLSERVAPGDSLFIWGFRPEVYYMSQLNPAARFIFHFPLVADWYPAVWKQETVDTLWAALPPYVLVLQVDYMPWVTGSDDDSNTLLQLYTELNDWLIFNYERETQIGNFFIWRRKP
jgi:4-amino-4-deoxy-L-arabinose transferase-like glycosyltransferase